MAPATDPGAGLGVLLATLGPGSLISWLCGSPWPAHMAPLGHTGAEGNQVESLVGSGWTTLSTTMSLSSPHSQGIMKNTSPEHLNTSLVLYLFLPSVCIRDL